MKKLDSFWSKVWDIFAPFLVGAIIVFMYLFFCCGCSVQRPVNKGNVEVYHEQLQWYYEYQQKHLNK